MKTEIKKRTFEAKNFPFGSTERKALNESALTSEYYNSHKYLLRVYFNATERTLESVRETTYRTKTEALKDAPKAPAKDPATFTFADAEGHTYTLNEIHNLNALYPLLSPEELSALSVMLIGDRVTPDSNMEYLERIF